MRLLAILSVLALLTTSHASPITRLATRRIHIQQYNSNSNTTTDASTGDVIPVNTTIPTSNGTVPTVIPDDITPTSIPTGAATTQAPIGNATTQAPGSGNVTTQAPISNTTSSTGTVINTNSTASSSTGEAAFPGPNSNPDTCQLVNFTDSIIGSTIYFNTTSTKSISYVDVHVTTRTPRAFLNYRLTRRADAAGTKVYTYVLPAYVSGLVSYWFTYEAPDAANVARGCDTSISNDTNVVASSRGASSPACPVPVEFSYSIAKATNSSTTSTVYFNSDDTSIRFVEVHLTYQGQQYNYRLGQQGTIYSKEFPFNIAVGSNSTLTYFYTYDANGTQCDTASYSDAGDATVPVATPTTAAPTTAAPTTAAPVSGTTAAPTTAAPTSTPTGGATLQPTEAPASSSTGVASESGSASDSESSAASTGGADSTGAASTGAASSSSTGAAASDSGAAASSSESSTPTIASSTGAVPDVSSTGASGDDGEDTAATASGVTSDASSASGTASDDDGDSAATASGAAATGSADGDDSASGSTASGAAATDTPTISTPTTTDIEPATPDDDAGTPTTPAL